MYNIRWSNFVHKLKVLIIFVYNWLSDINLSVQYSLQGQIGNPTGPDSPNKKYYDPRVWLRKGEETFVTRLKAAFEDLNAVNRRP